MLPQHGEQAITVYERWVYVRQMGFSAVSVHVRQAQGLPAFPASLVFPALIGALQAVARQQAISASSLGKSGINT